MLVGVKGKGRAKGKGRKEERKRGAGSRVEHGAGGIEIGK